MILKSAWIQTPNGVDGGSDSHDHDSHHPLVTSEFGDLLWIGSPKTNPLRDLYDRVVGCSNSVATRQDLQDVLARPCGSVHYVIHCREDRHPIDHSKAELVSARLPRSVWIDLLGPLALGVRNRSCSVARSLPFHSLMDEIQLRGREPRVNIRDLATPRHSVVLLAASARDAELYQQAILGHPVAFSWATPSQRSRFCNANLYWWDDSVAPAAREEEWRERVELIDPEGRGRHLWVCHSASQDQEESALRGGIFQVLRKPVLLDSLIAPLTVSCAEIQQGRNAA